MVSLNTILAKWKKYLGKDIYNVFDSQERGEGNVEELEKMLKGGQVTVFEKQQELVEYNFDYTYEMFEREFDAFLLFEEISEEEQEFIETDPDTKHEMRMKFEEHLVFNFEIFYDYDVLIFEKTYPMDYDGMQSRMDWKNPQSVAFRKRALNHITKEEFDGILINSYGGEGYVAAIVNGTELIEALKSDKKTVGGNVVIGVHDWMNGAGMYEESQDYIDLKLKDASIDNGDYGVGGTFGGAGWKY